MHISNKKSEKKNYFIKQITEIIKTCLKKEMKKIRNKLNKIKDKNYLLQDQKMINKEIKYFIF